MTEGHVNLWAPWRAEYLRSLNCSDPASPCFLCDYAASPPNDAAHFVVCRSAGCLMVMNRYPYTNGHLMIAPLSHQDSLDGLDDATLLQMARLIRLAMHLLADVLKPDGFNTGMNFGRCAGAGLPGHAHAHVVPRWSGDTNFMTVVGGVRLIPEDLQKLYERLRAAAQRESSEFRVPSRE